MKHEGPAVNIGVLMPSLSNRAGGMLGAALGQTRALYKHFGIGPHIFAIRDNETERNHAQWSPLQVASYCARGPQSFGYAPKLIAAMQAANLDLLHVHGLWMYPAVASWIWAKRETKPYVTSVHGMLDSWAVQNSHSKKLLAGWLYQNRHFKTASCLHALTHAEADSIRAFGLRNPICVIPLGIDLPQRSSKANRKATDRKMLLYLGRLHPKKGLTNLIHAWHTLQNRRRPGSAQWVLQIAGWDQGNFETTLKTLCRSLGVENSIHFVGAKFGAEKERIFREANAFVLPSVSEGLPVAILEAWSHGLPVLMTPQCNLQEGFQAGAAIPIQSNVEGIAEGLQELVSKSDRERDEMGESALTLVQRSFSWDTIVQNMYSVYLWLLKKDRIPDCVHII